MKTIFNLLIFILLHVTIFAQTGTISNISVSQRTDGTGLADITFTLSGTESAYYIAVDASFDEVNTFTPIPAGFLSGDIGPISPGTGKHIIWNGLHSFPNTYSAQAKVKLTPTTTPPSGLPCPSTPTVVYGGQTYNTVQIGTQCWLKENLNIGAKIPDTQEQSNNGTIEKYCYNNDESNCVIYGGLYQWNEMMQYVTTPGEKGICPTGWHIPTAGECGTLTDFLGGTSVAGGKMKSAGTIEAFTGLWHSPNTGATNESGYTAVPAAERSSGGGFGSIGSYGYLWFSSEASAFYAWGWHLGYNYSYVGLFPNYKNAGFSVRCLRDANTNLPCGQQFTINHVAGVVAPINKTITYGTVTNIPGELSKCWITSNLGADHQATAKNDATEASAGWYWQFNRKQGYKHDGTTRTPNSTWITPIIEYLDWLSGNDPCTLELGISWRIPTYSEWTNVDANGIWTNWNGPWNSDLKLHAAGSLGSIGEGSLTSRGYYGAYWSSKQLNASYGWDLFFSSGYSYMENSAHKACGFTLRCIRD